MYGKNIIDILIGVKDNKELDIVTEKLIDSGYFISKKSINDNYRFFSSIEEETGSGDIHIHLGILYTKRYSEFIILRNYLLNNADEVINYSNFKRDIIKRGIKDREEYKAVKSEYVSNLLSRAKQYYIINQ